MKTRLILLVNCLFLFSIEGWAQWSRTAPNVTLTTATDVVGIGMTPVAPYKLDIAGPVRANSTSTPGSAIVEANAAGVRGVFESIIPSTGTVRVRIGSYTNYPFNLVSNNIDRVTILNTNGFVGIGAPTPQMNLEVLGSATSVGQITRNTSATGYSTFRLYNDLNSNVRALEMDYSGSTYAGTLVSGGPTGESASLSTTGAFPLVFGTSNSARMIISSAGNVGIGTGTATPESKLHVAGGQMSLDGPNAAIFTGSGTGELNRYLSIINSVTTQSASGLKAGGVLIADTYSYANPSKNDLIVKGKVGIGTPFTNNPNTYSLAVNGKIGTKDVQIEAGSTTWSDYVFEPTYKLLSLTDLEKFIIENKHLPEIPSAKEVEKDGYSMNDLDVTLLKKVEELTLYVIEQQKQINALRAELEKK